MRTCQAINYYTWVNIYDISNRGHPFLIKQYKFEGRYKDGRKLQNGFVYLITSHSFYKRGKINPWYDWGYGVKDVPVNSIYWWPSNEYSTPQAVNIISFDLKYPFSDFKNIVTLCAEETNIMYMSEKHIYLTTRIWESNYEYSKIFKIYVSGKYIKPVADGKVKGSINNQFSMD